MKKVLLGTVAVFIILELLDMLLHGVLLASAYQALQNVWRPDMMEKMWVLHIVKLDIAFFFALIFSKGYEGKGIMEGVRYGFYAGMLLSIPFAYGSYASFAIPYHVALYWFLGAFVQYLVAGVALALIFGKTSTKPAA